MIDRIKEFQKRLRKNKIDCAVVSSLSQKDLNVCYLIGKKIKYSVLFVPEKGNCVLLVPEMEFGYAKRFVKCCKVKSFKKGFAQDVLGLLKKRKTNTIGINEQIMNVREYRALRRELKEKVWVDVSEIILDMRAVKDKKEIKLITQACKINDKVFQKLYKNIKKMKKEVDIVNFLLDETGKNGCLKAFTPVVATGKNSGFVHHEGGNTKLSRGFLLLDYGVIYEGYNSDMSRTIFLGEPTKNEIEMYMLLLEIQKKAVKMVKPGVKVSEIDTFVRKQLGKFSKNYTHSLGHGVGMDIHELPRVNCFSDTILEEGMVLTIEPGIYFPNKFGIRIEDTVVVEKKGAKTLTKTGKNLLVIK